MQNKYLNIFILLSLCTFFYTTNQQASGWCKPVGSWTVPTCDQCNRQTTVSANLCPSGRFEQTTVYASMYCQSLNYQCALFANGTINPAGKYTPINQWCKPLSGWNIPSCSDCHLVSDRSQCPSTFDTSAVYGSISCGASSSCTFVTPTPIMSGSKGWCKPIGSWTVATCSQCKQQLTSQASLCPAGFETSAVYGSVYCGSQSYKCAVKSDGYTVDPAGSYADQPLWCKPTASWLISDCSQCYKVSYANQCPAGYDQNTVYGAINCNNFSTLCTSTIQNIAQGWCKPLGIGSWTVPTCDQCVRQATNTASLCDSNKFETTTVYASMYCNNLNYKCGQNPDGSINTAGVYSPTNQWCKKTSTWIVSSCSNCKYVSDQSQCPTGFDTDQIYGSMQCQNGATVQNCVVPALPTPVTCTSCQKGWCKPIGSWTVPTCSQCQQQLVSQSNLCPSGYETTSVWGSMYCSTESYKCATFTNGTVNPAGQYSEIKHWCKPLTSWIVPTCAQCLKVSYAHQCPTGFDQTNTYGAVYCVNSTTYCQ